MWPDESAFSLCRVRQWQAHPTSEGGREAVTGHNRLRIGGDTHSYGAVRQDGGLSGERGTTGVVINLPKPTFFAPSMGHVRMLVGRLGVSPASSIVDAVSHHHAQQRQEGEGATWYLRKYVSNYSTVMMPISDVLRDKHFDSRRARRLTVPRGTEQDNALRFTIKALTSPPIRSSQCQTGTDHRSFTQTPASEEKARFSRRPSRGPSV